MTFTATTMASVAPYDLTPLVPIALLGLMLASGPLLWWLAKQRGADAPARLRALAALALFFCFDLVLVGAYTRLSDSGLGCPDWPGCYGSASPLGAESHIEAAQAARPSGQVTERKAWVEMLHRYLATGVGALITALAVLQTLAWRASRRRGEPGDASGLAWAWATFAWVCAQGAFGALTVTWKLYPAIVTAHLLGGMVLLALLALQAPRGPTVAVPAAVRAAVFGVLALAVVQIALGGWVSTNYAVLACRDVPTCQGQWWPAEMDFEHGFTVLRELGQGRGGVALPFAALTAIHVVHRAAAMVVMPALLALAWALRRQQDRQARRFALALAGLVLWQLASGLSNVVFGWPLAAALAHTGGAAALVVVLVRLAASTAVATRERGPAPPLRAVAREPDPVGHLHHV